MTSLMVEARQERTSGAPTYWSRSTPLMSTDWLGSALVTLRRLSALEPDWDGYGSPPLTHQAIDRSFRLVLQSARELLPGPNLVPGSEGDLQLEWHLGERGLQILVRGSGEAEYLANRETDIWQEGSLTEAQAIRPLFAWVFPGV